MKKKNDNICKFVSGKNINHIVIKNFIYETKMYDTNKIPLNQSNAICLVISGRGKLITESSEKELKSGTMFFVFSDIPHKIKNIDKLTYMYITFQGVRSQELFERYSISPTHNVFSNHEGLISFWQSSIGQATDENLDIISESVLLYSFSQLSPASTDSIQSLTNTVSEYMNEFFTDSSLSLSSTADALGYNAKYISRIFKKNVGITFSCHLKNIRIKHAIFLIEQGVTSIKNVALLSGYQDPLYFSKCFKQTIGISPKEFIKKSIITENKNDSCE